MRCFLGIKTPKRIKEKCKQIEDKIGNTGANVRLVKKDNLHWTVKFLGEISSKQEGKARELMNSLVKDLKTLEIETNGLGAFPNSSYIKTIWVGVSKNEDKFKSIIKKINEKLEENGFRKEKHDVTPHMTLARVKSGKNKDKLKEILHNMKNVKVGKMKVNDIILYESKLKPSGPVYNKIDKFHLGE